MIIAVNGWFWGQATAGSGQYLHHLLAYLPPRFPQVRWVVFLPEPGRTQPAESPAASDPVSSDSAVPEPVFPNVDIVRHRVPPLPRSLAKLWWEQITIPRLARDASALWVPYWAAPLWQPCPVVVTVHDLIPLLLPAYRGGLLQQLYTRLVGQSARRATAVLTVSHAAAQDIAQHLQIPPARIHVVYHGPNHAPGDTIAQAQGAFAHRTDGAESGDTADRADTEAAIRRRYGLPDQYFLYLGGFDVRKNVTAILQAYARYLALGGDPAIRLVIGGRLPAHDSEFAPDPRPIARALGLEKQIHFPGFIADADKSTVYRLAHAFLFPSLYEGFGMMLLEAMAAGTPVITSGPDGPEEGQTHNERP